MRGSLADELPPQTEKAAKASWERSARRKKGKWKDTGHPERVSLVIERQREVSDVGMTVLR